MDFGDQRGFFSLFLEDKGETAENGEIREKRWFIAATWTSSIATKRRGNETLIATSESDFVSPKDSTLYQSFGESRDRLHGHLFENLGDQIEASLPSLPDRKKTLCSWHNVGERFDRKELGLMFLTASWISVDVDPAFRQSLPGQGFHVDTSTSARSSALYFAVSLRAVF